MQDDRCIICSSVDAIPLETLGTIGRGHSSVPGEPSPSCSTLHSNLWSVFILTKVLHLPAEGCYQLLAEADGLNFGDWIKICDSCALLVTKVRTLENQIVKLRQEAEGLKTVAQEKFLQGTTGGEMAGDDGSTPLTAEGREGGENDAPASSAQATTGGEGCHEDDVISRISIFINSDACCVVAPLRKPPPHSPSVIAIETDQPLENRLRRTHHRRRRRVKKSIVKKIAGRLGRHVCQICNRSFRSLSSLRGHKWLHGDSRRLRCRICKKTFCTPDYVKMHMRVHTGERPYQCLVCQRKFSYGSALATHRRLHTNEKPKECVFCEKRFVTGGTLNGHLRRQHLKERPYNCKKCDQWFVTSGDLRSHGVTHVEKRSFRCSYCEKSFKSPSVLRQHVRVHFKPFECPVCAKSFVHLKSLEHHKRVHPFERKY